MKTGKREEEDRILEAEAGARTKASYKVVHS